MKKLETAANLISDVDQLQKTIYTGNGEPSLVSQIAALSTKVEFLEKSINSNMDNIKDDINQTKACIEDKIENLADTIEDKELRQARDDSKRTHFTTAMVAGGISILIAVLTFLFKTI